MSDAGPHQHEDTRRVVLMGEAGRTLELRGRDEAVDAWVGRP